MKAIAAFAAGFLLLEAGYAVPNTFFGNGDTPIVVIPAQPRFNADLTEEFFQIERWKENRFSGPWEEKSSIGERQLRAMAAMPVIFGEIPMAIRAFSDSAGVSELVIDFLDAGRFFAYQAGGENTREEREAGRDRRKEFAQYFKSVSRSVKERLEEGCGRGVDRSLGRSPMLRMECTDFRWDEFVLRYVEREDHSVSLHLFRGGGAPRALVDSSVVSLDYRGRKNLYADRVMVHENGDVVVRGLPMMTQGNTPFCGIHSLAMAGYYFGLRMSPEELAATADFKNTGSAKGSDIVDLHRSVAGELGMNCSISPGFQLSRMARSLEEGRPVIVWRRVSEEREAAHAKYAEARCESPDLPVPKLSSEEMASLPGKEDRGSPSHASIITGWNPDRGEIVYTEPWGESTRDRRMTVEEVESTAYAVFYFKP